MGRYFHENIVVKFISELLMNNLNLILVSIVEVLIWVICTDMYGKYIWYGASENLEIEKLFLYGKVMFQMINVTVVRTCIVYTIFTI